MTRPLPASPPPPLADSSRRTPLWLVAVVCALIVAAFWLQTSLFDRPGSWRWVAADWAPWLLIAPGVIWLATRLPIDQRSWRWRVPLHLLISLAVAALLSWLDFQLLPHLGGRLRLGTGWGQLRMIREPGEPPGTPPPLNHPPARTFEDAGENPPPPPPQFESFQTDGPAEVHPSNDPRSPRPGFDAAGGFRGPRPPWMFVVLSHRRGQIFFYWALLAITHAVHYHRRSVDREREALSAEALLAEARLTALQAQLQPHFLFNTLNAISSLVYTKPAAADEMICALSDLMRRVLAVSTRREVLLAEEIEMAKNYVAIQQVRFSESLQVHWKIAESVLYCTVPTLLLQPLIENAVVHAVEHNGAGTITVQAYKRGSRLVVDVTDTGPGAPTDEPSTSAKSTGIGHANTRERLAALYGEDHVFQFSFEPGAGARVHIEIPFRPAAA